MYTYCADLFEFRKKQSIPKCSHHPNFCQRENVHAKYGSFRAIYTNFCAM